MSTPVSQIEFYNNLSKLDFSKEISKIEKLEEEGISVDEQAIAASELLEEIVYHPIWAEAPFSEEIQKQLTGRLIEHSTKASKPDKKNRIEEQDIFLQKLKYLEISAERCSFEEYEKLLPLIKFAYTVENNGDSRDHTIKLIATFGSKDKAIEYLKRYELQYPEANHLVHDACLFTVPTGKVDYALWGALANKYMPNKS